MIERLLNNSGNFREILDLPSSNSIDLSSTCWNEHFVVVRGIQFDHMTISKTGFATNFVECRFDDCTFEEIVSDGHFSGAGNEWSDCRFKKCKFTDLIAPQSRFRNCVFDEIEIAGLRLCQTAFIDCAFLAVSVRGLATRKTGDRSRQLIETTSKGATALFQNCNFENSNFTACKFNEVCFEKCEVTETQFNNCSFDDVISRDQWLNQIQNGDPFIAFLAAAISEIRGELGDKCKSIQALRQFQESYEAKQTTCKDYSAVLYDGSVSDQELDVVEKILHKISHSFPF